MTKAEFDANLDKIFMNKKQLLLAIAEKLTACRKNLFKLDVVPKFVTRDPDFPEVFSVRLKFLRCDEYARNSEDTSVYLTESDKKDACVAVNAFLKNFGCVMEDYKFTECERKPEENPVSMFKQRELYVYTLMEFCVSPLRPLD